MEHILVRRSPGRYASSVKRNTSGIIIGRFMPPHLGHTYLVDFARHFTPDLTVFVCTLSDEPIPGVLRYRWMQEMFPRVRVVHVTEEIPEASRRNAGAQEIWAHAVLRHLEGPPDFVFASEKYGVALARSLDAVFVPVDPQRSIFPISAGMIRSEPFSFWEFIPQQVRPYFVCRVSVDAPDDSLVRALSGRFNTVYVSDYRRYRDSLAYAEPTITGNQRIIAAQAASEQALLRRAHKVLFLETDVLGSILQSGEPTEQLEGGEYGELLAEFRPHLVLRMQPGSEVHRSEAQRLGWPEHLLDPADPETDAVRAVEHLLERHNPSKIGS